MKSHYRVIVIGGGVVGTSVLYHLAKMGWTDVALLERKVLTAGSSWHAAGGFHALNADPNIAQLQAYTIDLLSEIEAESGQSVGMHMTGGLTLAGTPDRWEWLQSAYRTFQAIGIEDVRLVTPEEAVELCPIMSPHGILGGMWADREGYVDTTGTVHAYAGAARKRGASVHEGVKVEALERVADGWIVRTDKGEIRAEHVVNAAGLWAKQVGRMVGLELPVSPLNHHYLISDTIPEVAAMDRELPLVVDLEGFTYMRQDQQGMLLGIYEIDHQHWMEDGAPWEYGFELQQEDPDRIEKELTLGFERYPALQEVGVKTWVNGAFTFAPDGNPLVGPVRGLPGYWCACGVMAGFLQGGGVGKSLAEWIVEGEPEADVFGMDVARFGDFARNKRYIRETTGQFYTRRFVMTYPNEQLPAGRPSRMAPAHDAMSAAGARWGVSYGLEVPLYFAPSAEFEEAPTLGRSNAFEIVGEECRATREGAGLLDISAFSRFEVTGPNARAWLDRVMASRIPGPGRARLAPMLAPDGRLKGDLTVFCWPGGRRVGRGRAVLDHGVLLPARMAPALVHGPHGGRRACRGPLRPGGGLLRPGSERQGDRRAGDGARPRPALHGLRRDGRGPGPRACRAALGLRRAGLRDERAGDGARRPAPRAPQGRRRSWAARDRLPGAAVAAPGEVLRHLVGGVHPGLHLRRDRHGPVDRLVQGVHRKGRGAGRESLEAGRDAGGRRGGRRRFWLRADLAGRGEGRLRHLGRIRAHAGQVPRDGDGPCRQRRGGHGAHDARGRTGTGRDRDSALALRSRRRSDAGMTDAPMRETRRSGGRRGRQAADAAGTGARETDYHTLRHPFPSVGVFSDDRIAAMHEAALTVLEEMGMKVLLPEARDVYRAGGALVDEDAETVRIGRDMVEAAIASAPKSIRLRGGHPGKDLTMALGNLAIQPGAGAPHASDRIRGRRPGDMAAFEDFTKLNQHFDVLQMLSPSVEPQDVPTHLRHYATMRAVLTLSDKVPFVFSRGTPQVRDAFEMVRLARGLTGEELAADAWCYTIINTNSPRMLDIPMAQGLIDFARAGQMSVLTPFCLMGAMAPVTVAGAVTLSHAEAMAGIVLTQLAAPGAPVCYGSFTSNVDMKSGAPAFGTPEHVKANLAVGQMARLLGLPWRSATGAGGPVNDAQAAHETQFGAWGAVLAGATILIHGAGWIEGGLTVSFEKMITDLEAMQVFAELCAPTPAGDAEIALDALREVAPGGHFFGCDHTMERFSTAFYQPLVADWTNYGTWMERGAKDADTRATDVWQGALSAFAPPATDPGRIAALDDFIARRRAEGGAPPMS